MLASCVNIDEPVVKQVSPQAGVEHPRNAKYPSVMLQNYTIPMVNGITTDEDECAPVVNAAAINRESDRRHRERHLYPEYNRNVQVAELLHPFHSIYKL